MNASLPAGIESYLKEAGFTSTEMLVLRKLVEEDSLTIRELASKTGKSTGVLDQSMKKLLMKKIAERNIINGQPRYSIHSLDAIVRWVQHDMEDRKQTLERRHKNFESFISSLKVDKKRPDIEYFHGDEGIRQAYLKLLDQHQEFLTIQEVVHLSEEDPLRDFRVEFFRKRQARKIFQRVIAPDTDLSARFRSRDPFEFRRTLLLPSSELQASFEKTVVGDLIACINIQEKSACLLKYPDLARTERDAFNVLWARAEALSRGENPATALPAPPAEVPLKTRFYSSAREFLLSKKSIAAFVLFALVAGALTFGLYKNNRELNFQRMRDKVMAIAATGALQIDAEDLEVLRREEDYLRPQWTKVVRQLEEIRTQNSDVLFAYIFRKSPDGEGVEFIADSHSINPYANLDRNPSNDVDVNADGVIDTMDYLQWPGQPYPGSPPQEVFDGFFGITANEDFYEDAWGKVISGYAPIHNESGTAVGVLAIDIQASKLEDMTMQTFTPLYVFLALFILFLVGRIAAYGSGLVFR